jgi:F420-dependent oxidoreductase-like protein
VTEFCIFTEPQQGATYDELLACATTAERVGFDGFFRSDHYLAMSGDGMPGPSDAWTTLAGLARETTTLRLGTLVSSATYRHPGILAIQVANVDAMSGGRAELGLGTGWFEREHEAYGIPFPAKRFGLLEESLAIITGLWESEEPFSYRGECYTLVDAPPLVEPVQRPLPVIVGGGGATKTPRLAATYATEFNIGFQPEDVIADKFAGVRAASEQTGRSLKYSVALPTIVGDTDADVDRRAARAGIDPASLGPVNIGGSPQQAIDKIGRLVELGAERIYLQMVDVVDLEHIELVGASVLSAFR